MSLNNNNSTVKKPTPPQGTTDSPYLGSKISLVSKAKIRYEGILYTIDANESTVALSKVRSFGTEDRPTDRPVPARDEIFEYIIFRGADIEDLQVREPPQTALTQDPAIVESSVYSSNPRSTTTTTNANLGTNQTRSSTNQGSFSAALTGNQQGPIKGTQSSSNTDPLRQLNFNQQQQSTRTFDNQRRQRQDYNNDNPNSNRRGNNQKYGNYAEWPRTNNNSAWDNQYRQHNQRYPRQQNYDNNNRFYPTRRTNNNQQQQANGYYGYRERRNSTGDMTSNNQQRNNNNHRQQQQRERADSTRGNGTNQSALKFIGDFDFEKSNAEFDKNAIEDELKKSLSIKTKSSNQTTTNENEDTTKQEQEQEHEQEQQKPQTPTLPTEQQQQEDDVNADGFYDKQKSFFDRISCETTEKEKTTNSRRNWNEERRINAETFGLKYRPAQQGGGNQRNGQNNSGYNYNNRRYYSGQQQQQSYYGNGARYQRGHGSAGGGGGSNQQRAGRNTTYYANSNKRTPAY